MIKAKTVPNLQSKSRIARAGTCADVEFWDRFASPIGFSVGDGIYKYSTGWGAFCTVLCITLVTLYCIEKLGVQE